MNESKIEKWTAIILIAVLLGMIYVGAALDRYKAMHPGMQSWEAKEHFWDAVAWRK